MNPSPPLYQKQSRYELGLVGYPLGHSYSPGIHAAALKALNLEGEYRLYPIAPSSHELQDLRELLQKVRTGLVQGINVTIPYKRSVLPLLDDISPAAAVIGAVNTIYVREGQLVGDNTDAAGFRTDLEAQFKRKSFHATKTLVLGAGGSARAVTYALLEINCQVTIIARREEQAHALTTQYPDYSQQLTTYRMEDFGMAVADQALIVNATPVGMAPNMNQSPWPEGVPFPMGATVYDLVYNPRETLLVKQARAAGIPAATGLGMLVEQAALAFERWTGLRAPRQPMLESVSNYKS